MPKIKKPKSFDELKSIVNKYQDALSPGNARIINEIIREMERSGGVNQSNRAKLKTLMNMLANRNGVKIPEK